MANLFELIQQLQQPQALGSPQAIQPTPVASQTAVDPPERWDPFPGIEATPQARTQPLRGPQPATAVDPPQSPGTLSVRMPDGSIQQFNGITQELGNALQAGGKPLDQNGNLMTTSQYPGAGGGWLVNGQPLNKVFGQGYLPGQEDALRAMGTQPVDTVVQPPGTNPPPNTTDGSKNPNEDYFNTLFGLSKIPQIDDINLPENPQISTQFSPAFNNSWQEFAGRSANNLNDYWLNGDWPTMQAAQFNTANTPRTQAVNANAAQMNLSGIPQTQAQTPQSFDALQFLLSGKGYDDPTMARMNAGATDTISRNAASQRGAARIAAEQAGLTGSGADLAMGAQIGRRAGDATTEALNQLAIENARMGMQNRTTGAGMELGRLTTAAGMQNQANEANANRTFTGMQQNTGNEQQANLTNAAAANQAAIENAGREFAAMAQNVNNQQATNATNNANTWNRNMTRAGAQTSLASNLANQWGNAVLQKNIEGENQNATNTINRNLNQAQLNRQKQMFNVGTGENRYGQALGGMLSLVGGSNPGQYALSGANIGSNYQPNMIPSNAWSNFANSLLPKQTGT